MVSFLRQSTAAQTRIIGPFLDVTDFKTVRTALTLANTDCKLSKNGGTVVNKNSGGGTHISAGNYAVTFDATDTDTLGELHVNVNQVANALPVVAKFLVLPANAYDGLFLGTGVGVRANVQGWLGSAPIAVTTTGVPKVDVSRVNNTAQTAGDIMVALGVPTATAATGDPGTTVSAIGYLKQLVNVLVGTNGITTWASGAAPANAVSLSEVLRYVADRIALAQADLDTLTDPRGEPAQGAPPASATTNVKIDHLYKSWRNKKSNDGSTTQLYADDATTVDAKHATSVAAGTVTKDEWVTGP